MGRELKRNGGEAVRTERIRLPEAISVDPKTDSGYMTETRHYKLITPLFGGGVEAGKPDLITPIRASSIRGQLRFWWRATRGGQFGGSLEKMKEKEDKIWGSALKRDKNGKIIKGPSMVQLSVKILTPGRAVKPWRIDYNNAGRLSPQVEEGIAHSYTAFPLQPTREILDEASKLSTKEERQELVEDMQTGIQFNLDIEYPKNANGISYQEEVEAALWAWETFGGIGARTRRGYGAIYRLDDTGKLLTDSNQLLNLISEDFSRFVISGVWPDGVPYISDLSERLFVTSSFKTSNDVLKKLIDRLKEFRQMRSGMDRSKWSEADSIRHITGQWLEGEFQRGHVSHRQPTTRASLPKFPRAALGLPIIFEFPTRWGNKRKYGEPRVYPRSGGSWESEKAKLVKGAELKLAKG